MTKTRLVTLDKKKYMRDWRKKHPRYFIKYYHNHSETIMINQKRYAQTEKGKVSIQKYEQSEQRRKAKVKYQQKRRKKNTTKRGKI